MKKRWLLKRNLVMVIMVLIAFFSIYLNVDAANFAYAAFDWDQFYEENVGYWTDYCKTQGDDISLDDCLEITLSGKKEYYVNLYKLLTKYERKGYKLDDNILLATTFYYLTPDTFSDLPEEYLREYMDGTAYSIDGTMDSYDVDSELTEEYFTEEKDSLKMLTKHMFSYPASCIGVVGTPITDNNGNKYCEQGTLSGDSCVDTLNTYTLNYTEHWIAKNNWIGKFFGYKDEARADCDARGGKYSYSNEKRIDYNEYWEFLEESEYFDNKIHLTSKYSSILEKTNHNLMREMTDAEKEEYADKLIEIRKMIVQEIQSILDDYDKLAGFAETPDSAFTNAGCMSGSAWWPIGSDEVKEENGLLFAKDTPSATTINSKFGPRVHPITGANSQHSGIDIAGVTEGSTNVIAVKDGVVVYPNSTDQTNCPSSTSMSDCGGGYGNYVVIQHNDGTYSLYAHLYANSIMVTANDSVKQGQVIGKVGSSGNSTGAHLHFEIRQGGNSSSSAVDPLNFVSLENPRSNSAACSGGSSEMLKMLHWFEGGCNAKTNGNNYVVVNDGVGIPTVGYGVALKYNVDSFQKYGVNVSGMGFGAEIPIEIVDKVKDDILNTFRTNVLNKLSASSISLTEAQIDCLTMVAYQWGNIGNFTTTYPQYGNTEALKHNTYAGGKWKYYFKQNPSTGNGRAEATWKLFHEGIYTYGENC